MTFVCLWIPHWSTDAASSAEQRIDALLRVAPRVASEGGGGGGGGGGARGLIWADACGLDERAMAAQLCAAVREHGATSVRAGVARTAIAAEVGACHGETAITFVPLGGDRTFLAPHPLSVLGQVLDLDPALLPLLAGVGVQTCGDLAALNREEVEVRFGADGARLWRLARADDRRRPFGALPRTMPRASCAWTDYALRDTERMLFVIHRLLGHVCGALRDRGEGTREMTLRFALANRSVFSHPLRAARPTADRAAWGRLIRAALDRLQLPDVVTGITLYAESTVPIHDPQGDIFDRGFATARATEHAVAQLLDTCGTDVMTLAATDHPLLERRAQWQIQESVALNGASLSSAVIQPSLTLQLLSEPQPVTVATVPRRDHVVPVRYTEPARPGSTRSVHRGGWGWGWGWGSRPGGRHPRRGGARPREWGIVGGCSLCPRVLPLRDRRRAAGASLPHGGRTGISTGGGTRACSSSCARIPRFRLAMGARHPRRWSGRRPAMGYTSLGLTDAADFGGVVRFALAAWEAGVTPIMGCELNVDGHPAAFLARTAEGCHNLAALITRSRSGCLRTWTPDPGDAKVATTTGRRADCLGGDPRQPRRRWRPSGRAPQPEDVLASRGQDVVARSTGLHALTGPASGALATRVRAGDRAAARHQLSEWRAVFGPYLAVEVQLHQAGRTEAGLAGALIELAEEAGVPVGRDQRSALCER